VAGFVSLLQWQHACVGLCLLSLGCLAAQVPLIVSDPTRRGGHGSRTRALVELVDVLPTLAHLAGLSAARVAGPPLAGFSLAHLLATGGGPTRHGSDGGQRGGGDDDDLGGGPSDSRGGRAGAVTQFVRCPVTTKITKARQEVIDFRRGLTSAISHACVRDRRGWEWCAAFLRVFVVVCFNRPPHLLVLRKSSSLRVPPFARSGTARTSWW
jgi:hypothetical protein